MNRTVVRTSFVWAVVVLAVVAAFVYKDRKPASGTEPGTTVQPLAAGSAQEATNASTAAANSMPMPLAPVQLTSDQQRAIGLTTGTAEYKDLTGELDATGTVAVDERLISYVQVRFTGYIRKVSANATYQYVRRGQPLFTIYSPELYATEQDYLQARRDEKMLAHSAVEGVAQTSTDLAQAAEQRLRLWNLPDETLKSIERERKPEAEVTIYSPASGYITERAALPNLYVDPSTRLYTLADLSHVWVDAQVFQDDLGRVRPGDRAEITSDAYPTRTFTGRVEEILPQVDMTTRTAKVRIALSNPGILLKPGMFVNVRLRSSALSGLSVPASAVFNTGTRQLVFVVAGDGSFHPQDVVLGPRTDDSQIVVKGLSPHERIVTSANFLLDSDSQLQASAAGPTQSAAQVASTTQPSANILFTTDPIPPRKGSNTFRVRLADSKGQPITGAGISVVFYMPAMPAMGMSAMRAAASLSDRGNGTYEGSADLDSGGTWQVTITATKDGKAIAMKQLSVNATGGM